MTGRRRHQLGIAVLLAALSLPAASWAGDEGTRFVLDGGAVIRGDVVASDDEGLTIASPSMGRVRVPHDSVREVREPGTQRARGASAGVRLTPTPPREIAELEIRARGNAEDESAALLERVLSVRLGDPLPAKIAE
jgi:hypothetical protein